jgi:hypothetical protein
VTNPKVIKLPPGVSGADYRDYSWFKGNGHKRGAKKGSLSSANTKKSLMSEKGTRGAKAAVNRKRWNKWTGDEEEQP